MFQNKRRRYSHESRRDTVRCRPLPDIGAVRDPGRAEVDILLDARPPRDRTDRLFCFNVCSTGSAVFFRSVG